MADVRPRLSKRNPFGVGRENDLALILEEDSKFVLAADAIVGTVGYFRSMQSASARSSSAVAQRYWFDALILTALGVSIAVAVVGQGEPDGPNGPLWEDIAVSFAYFLPLLFRRRFPFLAPVVAAVAVAASTFLDGQRVPYDPMVFLLGMTIAFLFGGLPEPRQAIAGFAILARRERDRGSQRADRELERHDLEHGHLRHRVDDRLRPRLQVPGGARRRRSGPRDSSASGARRPRPQLPKSVRGSPASSMTSSATA